MKTYPSVDAWLVATMRWGDEATRLRSVLLECGLDEEVRWGKPCYAHRGAKVAIIQPFKGFLALMFFKGVLLRAPEGVLEEQGENTHAARRVCFRSVEDVDSLAPTVRDLVRQARAVEEAGTPLPPRAPLELVRELQDRLDADPELKAAFEGLTPGRQRAYHLDISGAKRAATRVKRVEKHVARILAGKGLRDR